MIQVSSKLEMNPALVRKLNAGQRFWSAAHDDGSQNQISGDAVPAGTVLV